MDQNGLKETLHRVYEEFTTYLNSLQPEEFVRVPNGKWTAGQQLDHIIKSVKPLAQILPNKAFIKEKFGILERSGLDYNELVTTYKKALKNGGKASGKFMPSAILFEQRKQLTISLLEHIALLTQSLQAYSEEELDQMAIPHPLLGKLSIREMLYFSIYHVKHHQYHIQENMD